MLPASRTLDFFDNFIPERFSCGLNASGLESCADPLVGFATSPKRRSNFCNQPQANSGYGTYHTSLYPTADLSGRSFTDVFEDAKFFPRKKCLNSEMKEEILPYSVSNRLPLLPQLPKLQKLDPIGFSYPFKRQKLSEIDTDFRTKAYEAVELLPSWRCMEKWKGIKIPKKRNSVTPAGLKTTLARQVEEIKKNTGVKEIDLDKFSTYQVQETPDGQVVTKQVHKKFLVSANRYYMGSSKYKGVCWNKKKRKWRARISNKGKREFLGDWDTEVKAAMIYDARVKQLYEGSPLCEIQMRLNFPNGLSPAK